MIAFIRKGRGKASFIYIIGEVHSIVLTPVTRLVDVKFVFCDLIAETCITFFYKGWNP